MDSFTEEYRELGASFRDIDYLFAEFICRLNGRDSIGVYQAALLTSYVTGCQYAALDLTEAAGKPLSFYVDSESAGSLDGIILPEYSEWREELLHESKTVATPGMCKPLVLSDRGLLYLYRYWQYEAQIGDSIKRRLIGENNFLINETILSDLFESEKSKLELNWQEIGAVATISNRFCIISGGPGTGKTTTVSKLLALLLSDYPNLQIDLVAPTGKAADRMVKSILNAKTQLNISDEILEKIPEQAKTIHRFLGYLPFNGKFRHNANHPCSTELLIVDEASMVSLPLFAHLMDAVTPECRIVLLGDKDQLASVENGSVFSELTAKEYINSFDENFVTTYQSTSKGSSNPQKLTAIDNPGLLTNAIVKLEHSYRFGSSSGIGYLSFLVNEAESDIDAENVLNFIQTNKLNAANLKKIKSENKTNPTDNSFDDISWKTLPNITQLKDALASYIVEDIFAGYNVYRQVVNSVSSGGNPIEVLNAFDSFRILCALNRGPYGVANLNILVEELVFGKVRELFYPGRPIMVLKNDYTRELFNGDIGIILNNSHGELCAYFRGDGDNVREFSPAYLPEHATAFAMTVHKSQGSEFERVLIILPDQDCRVISKEIIYTGITRAKSEVAVWSPVNVFKEAVKRRIVRTSGLIDRLI